MREDESIRDNLLKIIEDSGLGDKPPSAGKLKAKPSSRGLSFWANYLWGRKSVLRLLDLRIVNRILICGCVLLTIFLFFDFHRQGASSRSRFGKIVSGEDGMNLPEKKYYALDVNLKESIAAAKSRNIFSFPVPGSQSRRPASVDAVSGAPGNLKLVGIFWSDDNPQVLIEDEDERKTTLLNTGDYLGGVARVKKIYRNRVVIEAGGEEWELK